MADGWELEGLEGEAKNLKLKAKNHSVKGKTKELSDFWVFAILVLIFAVFGVFCWQIDGPRR